MAGDRKYWEGRMKQLYTAEDKDLKRVNKRMQREYKRTGEKIDKEIASYYSRYGKDDVIEYRQLVEQLTPTERDLLYQNMDEFIRRYPQYEDLMPIRRSIYELNRLEGLQLSVRQNMLELGAIEEEEFTKALEQAYERGYLSTMKGLENPGAFFNVDQNIMQKTLNEKWIDDKNYSDRIWDNKEKLMRTMNNEIRDGFIRGETYQDMKKILQRRTEVGEFDARRLITTEASFVMEEANAHAFVSAGVERYQITAVMDDKTSPTCQNMDGEIFRFDERVVGATAPPFHSFCRSTIIPKENEE